MFLFSRWERAVCRVKAIASSVERLLRYANCSGSSEAGSTEQMCSLTSFSKHLLKMGVRATGLQSFKHVILFFFGMGTMVDFFEAWGNHRQRGTDWKCLLKPRLAGKRMLWAHGLVCHPGPRLYGCSPVNTLPNNTHSPNNTLFIESP